MSLHGPFVLRFWLRWLETMILSVLRLALARLCGIIGRASSVWTKARPMVALETAVLLLETAVLLLETTMLLLESSIASVLLAIVAPRKLSLTIMGSSRVTVVVRVPTSSS